MESGMTADRAALLRAIEAWDRQEIRPELVEAERQRQAILTAFPLEAWPTLELDRYALGTGEQHTFCWFLEFGSSLLGSIGGGNAMKHLIFRRGSGEWYFPDGFATVEQAWISLRSQLTTALRLVRDGDFAGLSALDLLQNGSRTIAKAISVYHPESVLPVFARGHRDFYMRLLGSEQDGGEYAWEGCRRLLELVRRELPQLDDWSPVEIMIFLYRRVSPIESTAILKIAPGSNAALWPDCSKNGYVRVGWGDVGDVRGYASREEFTAEFGRVYPYNGNQAKVSEKAAEVWALVDLKPGDIVVANRGTSRIVGIGRVAEPASKYRPDLDDFPHTVAVSWEDTTEREIDPIKRWAFKTVAKVSQADYRRILAGRSTTTAVTPIGPDLPTPPKDSMLAEIERAVVRKGQVILYGPPGTGKTYHARRFSVWWLAERRGEPEASRILVEGERFQRLERKLSTATTERRVWWVVANPSIWSWDRLFAEGTVDYRYGRLQRNYPLVEPGDLVIGYQSNPDKRIVALGRITRGQHEGSEGLVISIEPVARVANGPTYDELCANDILKASEPLRFRNQGTLFSLSQEEGEHLLAWLQERDPNLPPLGAGESDAIGPLTRVTFHPSYAYEDFVEGYKPQPTGSGRLDLRLTDGVFKRLCRTAAANPKADYLLLIDEINRGNIPKIFGELITLLERDKRGYAVILPQSGESFCVPPNVYLVGTMNTADRSIRLLDAALRRRFAFIELMPDTGPLEGGRIGDLDLAVFLAELNRRVARVEGREKQIGHSFLIDDGQPVEDAGQFAQRFRHEILPLLQEYAYEDYRELSEYVGADLVDAEEQRVRTDLLDDPDALVRALAKHLMPRSAEPAGSESGSE